MDGPRGKWGTIVKAIIDSNADLWFMQETKCGPGEMKTIDGFVTYEHHRSEGGGGGLSISARTTLKPALVRDGGNRAEALTIDIHVKKMTISCTTAYGPQENARTSKKTEFLDYLEEEVLRSRREGKGFLLQGDLNSWLGPEVLPGDKRKQNRNGKMFAQFVKKNNLTIVNSLPLCKGLITRSRLRQGELVQSTLDFFVVCGLVLPFVAELLIDSEKKYRLTNYADVLQC